MNREAADLKISVIIPIYNTEKYLQECLDSVINQSFADIEIICINDGSTDSSLSILESYAQKDERIKVLSQSNKGQAVARNIGLDLAKGEYIFFLDSDDYLHKDALKAFYQVAVSSKAPIVVSNNFLKKSKDTAFKDKAENIDFELHHNTLTDLLSQRYISSVAWNKLYKKEVLKNKRFIDGIVFEDWPFVTTLFSEIPFYASFKEAFYFYNDVNTSTVRSAFTVKKIKDYMTGIYYTYDYYQQPEKLKYWKQVRKVRIKKSLKMMITEIFNSPERDALVKVFYPLFKDLLSKNIIKKSDFSPKTRLRLFCLLWKM